jgi:hypothetical protein
MMRRIPRRFEFYALLWGGGAALFAALRLEAWDVAGVAVGTALAMANWFVFNWVGRRVAAVGTKHRFLIFLAVKMTALLGIIWLILSSGLVSPLGLMLGLSSLVFGVFARSSVQVLAEGDAALREER